MTMSTQDDRIAELLAKPSLAGLAYALRHPDAWPEGFVWNFYDCRTCAMGMAAQLWASVSRPIRVPAPMERWTRATFNLSSYEVEMLFGITLPVSLDIALHKITPEHVADAIDNYLTTHPAGVAG
jgi:hypothetical protein